MKTELLTPDDRGLDRAAEALRAGRTVAFPTETVYGLGAAAEQPAAIREVFRVKGRPADHPLIVHLGAPGELERWTAPTAAQRARAEQLSARFWPGPLTLVLPRAADVPDEITAGQDTIAVRVPGHPLALELLRRSGLALVAPSANRFGRISPTRAEHVLAELDGLIPFVLDGGPARVGLESTILDLSGDRPAILRPGRIGAAELAEVLGETPAAPGERDAGTPSPRVSGSLPSHYAPAARTVLVPRAELQPQATAEGTGTAVLAFHAPPAGHEGTWITLPEEAAAAGAQLYAALRELDRTAAVILVEQPPAGAEWAAVRDRLQRAAAERTQNA